MKFCMNCGAQMADDAMFCMNCGQKCSAQPSAPVDPDFDTPEHMSASTVSGAQCNPKPKNNMPLIIALSAIIAALVVVIVVLLVGNKKDSPAVSTDDALWATSTTTTAYMETPETTSPTSSPSEATTVPESTTIEYTAVNNHFISQENSLVELLDNSFRSETLLALGTNYKVYYYNSGKYSDKNIDVPSMGSSFTTDDRIYLFENLNSLGKVGAIVIGSFYKEGQSLTDQVYTIIGFAHFGSDVICIDKGLNSDISYDTMCKEHNATLSQNQVSGLYISSFKYRSQKISFAFDHSPAPGDKADICWVEFDD